MTQFKYPTYEGCLEVAGLLGIPPEEMGYGQDWEYIFPNLEDLPTYMKLYAKQGVSDQAKRVLGCFVFSCLEDHMSRGGTGDLVHSALKTLVRDYDIHKEEFAYWANTDDPYYDEHPEDGWHIMTIVREYQKEA